MLSSSSDSLVLSHDKKNTIDALKSVSRVNDSNSSQEETKDQRNTNLDRFFTPDDIDPCHFSFEDILWKPTASRFKWRRAAPKPNPLFQILEEEERIVSTGLSRSTQSDWSRTGDGFSSTTSSDTQEDSVIISMGEGKGSLVSAPKQQSVRSSLTQQQSIRSSLVQQLSTHSSLTQQSLHSLTHQLSTHSSLTQQLSSTSTDEGWILKHINGYATSGQMTAILGASGAGKTTLLSILCGRNTGYTGTFRINGREVNDSSLR
ncbi:hypothetical protein BLSTO_06097 [Blastocystis sp. subtype 1]